MNTSHLELWFAIGVVVTVCIVGVLWWLWKRFRRRRPAPQKEDPK
jgi:membrane protein implicated in regulation of membrane protease activity